MLHTNRMKRSMVLVQYIQLRVSEDRLFQSKETRSSAFHTHIHKCKIQSVCVCVVSYLPFHGRSLITFNTSQTFYSN